MPQRHLIRSLIALLLVALFLVDAGADNNHRRNRVKVDVSWSPCPPCDDDGRPLAEAVRYEVFASREGAADVPLAETRGDTTCTLKLEFGVAYRVRVVGYDDQGRASEPSEWSDPVIPGHDTAPGLLPSSPKLPPNRPNPFNPATTIVYSVPGDLPTGAPVQLAVFDVRGQLVRRFDVDSTPGTHEVSWHGTDDRGATVASGVYVTRFICGDETVTRRMTMLK